MRKPLTPRIHGYLDYLVDVAFISAPFVFGYRGHKAAAAPVPSSQQTPPVPRHAAGV
jgi:hypothetical protein